MSRKKIIIVVAIALFGLPLVVSCGASAMDKASIKAKAALEGIYNCAKDGAYKSEWLASSGGKGLLDKGLGEEMVKLPYGFTDASDNNTNCKQIMEGFLDNAKGDDNLNKGFIPSSVKTSTNGATVANYYKTLGYSAVGAGDVVTTSGTQQLKISPNAATCRDKNGNLVNATITSLDGQSNVSGNELVFPTIVEKASGNWFWGDTLSDASAINVPEPGSKTAYLYSMCGIDFSVQDNGDNSNVYYTVSLVSDSNNGGIVSAGGSAYSVPNVITINDPSTGTKIELKSKIVKGEVTEENSGNFDDYKLTWEGKPLKMIQGLNANNGASYKVSSLSSYGDLKLTRQEIYDLYTYYVKEVYKAPVACEGEASWDTYVSAGAPDINWSSSKKCKYDDKSPNISTTVGNLYGVESNKHFGKKLSSLADVVAGLESLGSLNDLDTSAAGTAGAPENTEDDPTADGEVEITCANSGGAMSLGWIVCPILDWLGDAANNAYNDYVEPSLKVDPKLFTEGNEGVRAGWETFRNIANTLFIILLLVVIFSQLTGVGIDNYGIKKILPKLIVTAVLINLSYLLCLIAVDLSNILGNGFQEMFKGLSSQLPAPELNIEGADSVGEIATTAITGVAVLGALVAMVGVVWQNPAILLSLLVAALGIAIAIFFLFILLAAREAAIIVLVVLAPLAVACYMLPNTKKMFDKWLKFFEALLLVYPIAGLLVGGGNYVSTLLLSAGFGDNGFLQAFTAMIVGIVPIFFIPTVLKGSFAAMGKVGATLTGIGTRARAGATKRMANSRTYKNAQERGLERQTRIKAGVKRNKDGTYSQAELGRVGTFLRGGKRGVARSRAQFLKDQDTRRREDSLMGTGFMAGLAGVESKADTDRVSNAESMLEYGKVGVNGAAAGDDNPAVNTNDAGSMKDYHAAALGRYRDAVRRGDVAGQADAMAEIKAAQNIMSKTDAGRAAIQNNYEDAIRAGDTEGLNTAAAHLMSGFGDKYKSVNRGMHSMISDLSTNQDMSNVKEKIMDGTYNKAGTSKYTEESLAGADDAALNRMIGSMGSMTEQEKSNIQGTAYRALQKSQTGNLNVKPEVAAKLEKLAAGYTPAASGQAGDGGDNGSSDGEAPTGTITGPAPTGPVPTGSAPVGPTPSASTSSDSVSSASAPTGSFSAPAPAAASPDSASSTISPRESTMEAAPKFDFKGMSDDAVLDMATAPGNEMSNPLRQAAENEYYRRKPGERGGGNVSTGNTGGTEGELDISH